MTRGFVCVCVLMRDMRIIKKIRLMTSNRWHVMSYNSGGSDNDDDDDGDFFFNSSVIWKRCV